MRTFTGRSAFAAVAVCAAVAWGGGQDPTGDVAGTAPAVAVQLWSVHGGTTTFTFDLEAMAGHGLGVGAPDRYAEVLPDASVRRLSIRRGSTLSFGVRGSSLAEALGGDIRHVGDLAITTRNGAHVLRDLAITPGREPGAPWTAGEGDLLLHRIKAGFDPASSTLVVLSAELRPSPALAAALGDPGLADLPIGSVRIHASAVWTGGAVPEDDPANEGPESGPPTASLTEGGDMTFCQLYGLTHLNGAREGDIAALSEATTSWNIGTADLMWFAIPNEEHPFIVMNLYRLKDGRFEQIGQSHIKHGFYALASHQCGGPACTYENGHGQGSWLGTGCTDTYGASLNGSQSGMGPKYEVNPWTGYWYYPTSHMAGGHNHDRIQHRIQVHDSDLDPAQNEGATYYAEGYYVMLDDIDVMNSAAWKPVTVSGVPGGRWTFGMSGSGDYPNIGFAVDAWEGAGQTLVAQEIPVEEFVSPDGRCVLAAKATQVSETTWRYEYALLNVDMDRQAGSLSIPVGSGIAVSNVGFHAVEHHDEPFNTVDEDAVPIDNAAWTPTVTSDAVTWETTTNPVRWGTMYSFRFDADAPPDAVTATVGMFRPGDPAALTATTTGPAAPCPADLDGDGVVGMSDLLQVLAAWGSDPGGPPDFDGDGTVGMSDLLVLLAAWGAC